MYFSSKLTFMKTVLFALIFVLFLSCNNSPKSAEATKNIDTVSVVNTKIPPLNNLDYLNIVGTPVKFGQLEIAQYEFPDKVNWNDAKLLCSKLGDGWRLPNIEELNKMYQYSDRIGGFIKGIYYWSSSPFGVSSPDLTTASGERISGDYYQAALINFANGYITGGEKDSEIYLVRAVKGN